MITVRELEIAFGARVVSRIDALDLRPGEIVGVAGESGSGKSMTALAILRLARSLGASVRGSIAFGDRELVDLPDRDWRTLRGRRIAMIMQSPRGSLNPTMRLGTYFDRTLRLHGVDKAEARRRRDAALADVSLE